MSQSRIQPLDAPYSEEVQSAFDRVMPPGVPPLMLFRTVGRNPRVLQRMMAGGLLDRGSISLRERELLILRSTARCGAEYEWGVHVAAFNAKAGFSQAQLADTCRVVVERELWEDSELALLALVDALHERADIEDDLWQCLQGYFSEEQLVECVMLAGFYHAVSFLAKGFRVALEPHAPRFPA